MKNIQLRRKKVFIDKRRNYSLALYKIRFLDFKFINKYSRAIQFDLYCVAVVLLYV